MDGSKKVLPWQRVEPTIITKIDYRNIVVKTYIVPGTNKHKTFATFLSEGTRFAGVIALTKDKKVIVARQFRPGPERVMDDIPGGMVEEGEEPEAAAIREFQEETGYIPGHVEYLGVTSREGYTNGKWYYYLVTGCELASEGQHLDDDELVEVKLMSITDFITSAKTDQMTDPAAVLFAYDKLKEMEEL